MTSISNNEIKKVKSLQQKKFRDEYGLFVVEGEKMVEEAQMSGLKVEAKYLREDIGQDAMSRISSLTSPSPALAVVRKPADICFLCECLCLLHKRRGYRSWFYIKFLGEFDGKYFTYYLCKTRVAWKWNWPLYNTDIGTG